MFQRTVSTRGVATSRPTASSRLAVKQGLQDENTRTAKETVKAFSNTTGGVPLNRKRRALGDVSNQVSRGNVQVEEKQKFQYSTRLKQSQTSNQVGSKQQQQQANAVAPVPAVAATRPTVKSSNKPVVAAKVSDSTAATSRATRSAKESKKVLSTSDILPKPLQQIQLVNDKIKRQKTLGERLPGWDDLDKDDEGDVNMVSEYVVEIFDYMRYLETVSMPDPNYMSKQKELQWKMRAILIDWLVEVHLKFRLLPETLFLTVNLIDRFLSLRTVSLAKLQLVGITAMFIAAKYEEVFAPSINQFAYIADGGYSNEEIIKAERYLLSMMDFKLQYPSPLNFLRRCSKADDYDLQNRTLAKYLMEITLMDENFLPHPSSLISAAALYLSRVMLSRDVWDINLVHYSGYTVLELKEVVMKMLQHLSRERKHFAIYNKYASSKFMRASIFVDEWMEGRSADDEWDMAWE